MWQSQAALEEQDLRLLPAKRADAFPLLLALRGQLRPDLDPPGAFTAADRFRDEAASSTCSRALVSHELLGRATPAQVATLLDALAGYEAHVVVAVPKPAAAPSALLERFCAVVDIEPDRLDQETDRGNAGMGLVQAEVLRRVNLALGDRLPHPRAGYREQGKQFLDKSILRRQAAEPAPLPKRLQPWCNRASRAVVDRLVVGGYDIVGDLDDLIPDARAFTDGDMEASDTEVACAATTALADIMVARAGELEERDDLRQQVRTLRRRARVLRRRVRVLRGTVAQPSGNPASRSWVRRVRSRRGRR